MAVTLVVHEHERLGRGLETPWLGLRAAKVQGRLAPDFDLDLAFEILSGPLYDRLLITQHRL
ncbi:hypothetical protein [Nonomuraea angiospora]|uniref:hypothetical protein n=1 Tax=Nonomuraea angiospora TaxID=46172 RepID=UPI0029AD2824|nr:hypothetical protein [Nonomuraea angiospora]MDX3110680.1 hypothetical protein [Nonomuraea angiospora]